MERLTHVIKIAQVRANKRFIGAHLGNPQAVRQAMVARAAPKTVCAAGQGVVTFLQLMNAEPARSAWQRLQL